MAYKFQLGAAKLGGAITSTGVISGSALSASSPVAIGEGGTGASTAAGALSNLGLSATAAELNVLDGITATVGELNILDGVTATTAELNILDGVTATATELNLLDGVTATTAELNYVDGVTSAIQTQLDAKQASSGHLTAIAGLDKSDGNIIVANGTTYVAENGATARASLGLAIGTNVQAYDAELAAIAGLTSAADKGIQFTGDGTAATYDLTTAGKALLDDANAAAQRNTLELGTTNNVQFANITAVSGTYTGDMTITGDLIVNGGVLSASTSNLLIEDAQIVIADNAAALAANQGIYIGADTSGTPLASLRVGDGTGTNDAFVSSLNLVAPTIFASTAIATDDWTINNSSISGNLPVTASAFVGNASTATALANARTIGGVSFDGTANIDLPGVNTEGNQNTTGTAAIATTVTLADESSDTSCFVAFSTDATGNRALKTGTNLTFNSSNGQLTATSFSGDGNALTNITSDKAKSLRMSGSNAILEGNHNAGAQDVMLCDTSLIAGGANLTITMPQIQTDTVGRVYIIKDVTGAASASGKHIVVVSGSNSEGGQNGKIDGQDSITIQSSFGAVNLLACSGSGGIGFFYSIF